MYYVHDKNTEPVERQTTTATYDRYCCMKYVVYTKRTATLAMLLSRFQVLTSGAPLFPGKPLSPPPSPSKSLLSVLSPGRCVGLFFRKEKLVRAM